MSSRRPPSPELPQVDRWLRRWRAGTSAAAVDALPGDVSPRRYHRLRLDNGATVILALYPAGLETTCRRFLRSGELLGGAGIPVPEVLASDCQEGWMLLEDLGSRTLFHLGERPWRALEPLYRSAARILERLASLPPARVSELNPPLGREQLRRELEQTWRIFLEPRGLTGDAATSAGLETALDRLCDHLGEEPPHPSHRDFMPRNLVPREGGSLVVLDHQDLRLAPPAYDLASLLNDSLFPPAWLERSVLVLAPPPSMESYHRAAAQRTLKAVGTFARFAREGSPGHLPLVPPTLARAHRHLRRLPEAREVADRLEPLWRPVMAADPHAFRASEPPTC